MQYHYITSNKELDDYLPNISHAPQLALDLEFDKNRFRYGFNLCLVQIFDGSQSYLIDPLSNHLEINRLFPVLENPDIQKVVFSFGEDLRLLHSLGCFPKNLYDLQFAAALLNFPPGSLASLLENVLGITVGKSSQQSNWYTRPLSEDQKKYAEEDVLYLLEAYQNLHTQLLAKKRGDWIAQENAWFESQKHQIVHHNVVLKEKYKEDMSEFDWHIFSRLMFFREEHAKKINRPTYHVAQRATLQKIAQKPEYLSQWMNIATNHHTTKNELTLQKLTTIVKEAIQEATKLQLSKTKKAAKRLSKDEYLEFRALEERVKYAKKKVFGPIQKRLEQDFGEHTKTFILSNRLIKDLVSGHTQTLLPYKRDLLKQYAQEEQVNINDYLK